MYNYTIIRLRYKIYKLEDKIKEFRNEVKENSNKIKEIISTIIKDNKQLKLKYQEYKFKNSKLEEMLKTFLYQSN